LFFLVACCLNVLVSLYYMRDQKKKKKLNCNLAKHGQGEANQGTNLHVEYGIFFVWNMLGSLSLVIMGPTVKMNIALINLMN
jgi:hypothetical protein